MRWFRRGRPNAPDSVDRGAEQVPLLAEFHAEVDRETPHLLREIEAEAARTIAELEAKYPRALSLSEPEPTPAPPAPEGGPSWMPPEEWLERLEAYQREGRTDAQIQEVAEHLERRGPPPTRPERIQRATSLGYVAREEYLSAEDEASALMAGPNGFPDARLKRVRDRLLVVTPRGWINPRSRTAATRAGLSSFPLRGTGYHESAARNGDFRPGTAVPLVREPENSHDRHAIAVYAAGARQRAGYVPRGYAKRLAKLIDAGADMVAVSTRGGGPGQDDVTPQVLVCEQALWDHLNREESQL